MFNVTKYYPASLTLTDLSASESSSNSATPSHSQYQKKVSLRLYTDGSIRGALPSSNEFIFPVNPEEFNVSRQHRVQVTQTLGDPFIDEFGLGLATLNIRGTTGWRARPGVQNVDGYEAFNLLHRNFINKYFELRLDKLKNQQDPSDIKLVIINNVDDLVFEIIPVDFQLLRNKVKPLLYQYNLTFKIITDMGDVSHAQTSAVTNKIQSRNWLTTLVSRATALAAKVSAFTTSVCQTFGTFIQDAVDVINTVSSGAADIANFLYGITSTISSTLDAVRDAQTIIQNLDLDIMIELNQLSTVLGEFNCYLANGIQESWLPDFSAISGITDCAATHGIEAGSLSDSTGNTVLFISELKEASRQGGISTTIGIKHEDDNLSNVFSSPETPVVVSSTLDTTLVTLRGITRSADSYTLDEVYNAIETTLNTITLDKSLASDDDYDENLTKISQFKTVLVKTGQSLIDIAYQEFGQVDRWTEIAAANDIVIENAASMNVPLTTFTVSKDLYHGSTSLELNIDVPTRYAEVGCVLELKDAYGHQQSVQVKEIKGKIITFYETISQLFTAPISVVRYTNLVGSGVYDGKTTLTSNVSPGLQKFPVAAVKDIFVGYTLFISGKTEAQSYTVSSVDYLENYVTVDGYSVGFLFGDEVKIFNTETNLTNLTPGIELKVPVMSGDSANAVQSDTEIYGGDLTLNEFGFLDVKDGDLSLTTGLENLKQAIIHRVVSDYESLIIHPKYGCGLLAVIGEKNTPSTRVLAKAALVEALQREPRIDSIKSVYGVTAGDSIKFSVKVESVSSNTATDLNFVIGGN